MERKVPFIVGETYHLYTRGVEKRVTFTSGTDYDRMLLLLRACNSAQGVRIHDLIKYGGSQGEPLRRAFEALPVADPLVEVSAYALMPNHMHLIVRETSDGGISKFMLKLLTAYSMYFNTKYERSGPLFTRPYRSSHIDTDEYLRWVFAYITLNPLELFQSDWKTRGLNDPSAASHFLRTYRYSSYTDYYAGSRPESRILNRDERFDPMAFDALLGILASDVPDREIKRDWNEIALV